MLVLSFHINHLKKQTTSLSQLDHSSNWSAYLDLQALGSPQTPEKSLQQHPTQEMPLLHDDDSTGRGAGCFLTALVFTSAGGVASITCYRNWVQGRRFCRLVSSTKMGKKKKGAVSVALLSCVALQVLCFQVCNNPVAMARAAGPAPVTGPTIRDYLSRDRPSL